MPSRSWARVKRLWHSSGETQIARRLTRPPELLYSVDETPAPALLVLGALQQVALLSTSLAYPIILGQAAGLSPAHLLDFISISMLALGISTILISLRSRFVGCGYLCPATYSQIYLGTSLLAIRAGGLQLMFGMTFLAGVMQLVMAPLLRHARGLLPPEVAGLVVSIVGLSSAVFGVHYSLGTNAHGDINPSNLIVGGISLATMVVLNVWTKGYARIFCVLLGIIAGYAAAAAVGLLHPSTAVPDGGLAVLRFPDVDLLDVRFDLHLLAPFAAVAIAGVLHMTGNVSTAQRIDDTEWVRPDFASIRGGLAGMGLGTMVCGLIGSAGINSSGSSIGLSVATGVTSRSLSYAIGAIFALLALLPSAAAAVATIPTPVIGATLFFTAAFILSNGLQMITGRMLDSRRIIVIGFSFSLAIMADVYHDLFAELPGALQPVFGNALVLGTICAVVLNVIMRIGVRRRVTLQLAPGHLDRDAVGRFLSEQGAHWAARPDVIARANFGVIQSLELLGGLPGGAEIDASFDEFNLDLRIRYDGTPLVITEQRPSPRRSWPARTASLLAGYLLRCALIASAAGCRERADPLA